MAGYFGIKWRPTSKMALEVAESQILTGLKTPYTSRLVNIGPVVGRTDDQIWTVSLNEKCTGKTPLVLLHGLGAGICFWAENLDKFASSGRPIYALDHLGFARSSRPKFSTVPAETEHQFVMAIEEWRKRMKLDKFILMGHSLGGFLAMSYTLSFPERIAHLILADPWGLTGRPQNPSRSIPLWIKFAAFVSKPFEFLWVIRVTGPLGPSLLRILQRPMKGKFSSLREGHEDQKRNLVNYGYHCNAQDTPSGERAFRTMSDFLWAKLPMNDRIPSRLEPDVDLTVLYGAKSFIWRLTEEQLKSLRGNEKSYTNVQVLEKAGHLLFHDDMEEFDRLVLHACSMADEKQRITAK